MNTDSAPPQFREDNRVETCNHRIYGVMEYPAIQMKVIIIVSKLDTSCMQISLMSTPVTPDMRNAFEAD